MKKRVFHSCLQRNLGIVGFPLVLALLNAMLWISSIDMTGAP